MKQIILTVLAFSMFLWPSIAQKSKPAHTAKTTVTITDAAPVITGAARLSEYLPLLKNKRVALIVNQTSEVNGVLLPDTLLKHKVNIVKVFSPEHGFRGLADAGAKVNSSVDEKTGLPLISLYGNNKKPSAEQLKDVDVLVYDLQDVGVRFYTYISTLQYAMEACAAYNIPLIILDRPNPLGFMVDGPILEKQHQSFVGMQAIPVVYGMTPGEYAKMLVGEKWLSTKSALKLTVIPCSNYTHKSLYNLPVAPSPNLKNMTAIYLYPSLCFFEGTPISLGRGTTQPFQQFGHPSFNGKYGYSFKPISMTGASDPPLKNQTCYGMLITDNADSALAIARKGLQLQWLIDAYQKYGEKEKFFTSFFEKLSGTTTLRQQIKNGLSAEAIKKSWQPGLEHFKRIRSKYLLYAE
jgi:uncharacterized protein YbbC (DUF1343 family)